MPRNAQLMIFLPLTALLLSACNPAMRITPRSPVANNTSAPLPRMAIKPSALTLSAEARAALKLATARVADAKKGQPKFADADSLLAQARAAAEQGNSANVISLSKQALARADLVMLGQYQGRAKALVQELNGTTGLSDTQLARVKTAETALSNNQPREAYEIASRLSDELKNKVKSHKVNSGESLWTISARDDIYANPWLWPLIWQANRESLKNPGSVRAGQTLKIRANPTVDEVVNAVNYAHQNSGTRISIGEVKEVAPE
ncbi:MAG: LysM peptidoglycan-binding domain-containing protein [Pseudomonadota bacterium]